MAMTNYATVNDVIALWRVLSASEAELVSALLPIVSAEIREKAKATGRDFDAMLAEDDDLAEIAKSVTVDVVKRYINDSVDSPSMSQMSQSAGGYSVSGTFLVPGGGLFLKKSELARLGLKRQLYGVIEFC